MPTIVANELYTDVLEHLGDLERGTNEALRQYAVHKAQERIAQLQRKVQIWEDKYGCSYDLFAYRTATDVEYVGQLDADPETSQWEGDAITWEFYAAELTEWRRRLLSILTTS